MLKNKLNWIDFKFEIKNSNYTSKLLKNKLDIFWKEVMDTNLTDNQHIWLLFRLQWVNNNYVTIGKLVKLNKEDKDYLFDYITKNMDDKSEYYREEIIKNMIFSYTIKKGKAKEKITFDSINSSLEYQFYHHHKIPITMNPLNYGKLIKENGNEFIVQINRTNLVIINKYDSYNDVKLYKEGDLIYQYRDFKIDDNTFVRTLANKKFTFKDNKLVLLTIDKSVKFIDSLLVSSRVSNKIITMDIETFIKDGVHIPYVISWNDGIKIKSYYILDFNSSKDMLILAIKDLMIKKYNNYKVYIHNMAGFDAIFLLKILTELGTIKPIIHHGDLISINFKFKDYNITFRDSQQLLIMSLRKLAKAFGVSTQKSIFPYRFVNENNLDYNGPIPDFKYFDGISSIDYNCYIENYNIWSMKDESIKYCEIDCVSLYQIITKFSNMIFELFKIDILNYPTLSSLAFAIYRTHFLGKDEIPQLSGQIAKDIRLSYTGGAVDMFIPRPPKGIKVYCYDVNSLYPYVMSKFDMPIGRPTLFYGDIRKIDSNAFGFFYCNIIAPDNLKHPIIQTHVKINNTYRTMAPLGQWKDMVFSAELDNAVKYGYKFEILWGYKFDRKNIFKGYVENLYNFRLKYDKSNPLNLIAKLLLNSLYGRFGMIDSFPDITIFNDFKSFKTWFNVHNEDVINFEELGDKIFVQHRSEDIDQQTELYGGLETHNVSIGIAAAITAYARIHMSQFKNNSNFNLYYTDTDSIYIDKPLSDDLVNNKILGKMKLENVLTDAIFLAPKVYYLITESGEHIYKVKGLKHGVKLTLENFENLLFEDSLLEKIQTKWIKNISKGFIEIRDDLYTLRVTDNKRELIYDVNNKLIKTKPYVIDNKKEVVI